MVYEDKDGNRLFVRQGLGAEFGVFKVGAVPGASAHRVKSKLLPMVKTQAQAEKNLENYARGKKLIMCQDE